jgi:hypothetical protein
MYCSNVKYINLYNIFNAKGGINLITSEDILRYSELLKSGADIENPKIELKKEWWNLSEDLQRNEFLKDITAMANTPGETGYIIVGIDPKGELYDAVIPLDPSKIRGIICKHIQDPMNVEIYLTSVDDKNISVIEVPMSLNKPHIIKEFRSSKQTISMFIPIRKGTSINAANKYDIDFMYLEKNRRIVIDYGLDVKISNFTGFNSGGDGSDLGSDTKIGIPATVINKGINVNCIMGGKLIIEEPLEVGIKVEHDLKLIEIDERKYHLSNSDFPKIHSNDTRRFFMVFGISKSEYSVFAHREELNLKCSLELTDIMENTFKSNIFGFR